MSEERQINLQLPGVRKNSDNERGLSQNSTSNHQKQLNTDYEFNQQKLAKSQSHFDLKKDPFHSKPISPSNENQFFSNRNSQQSLMRLSRQSGAAALSLYQGGFSQTISANTLRNSHSQWSFPKGDRFNKIRIDNNAKMLCLPSTLDPSKTHGFGFGFKQGLQIISGRDSPPPNSYKIRGQFEKLKPNQGRSFGMPHSVYQKVYMPSNKYGTSMIEAPGPGTYEQKGLVGINARKFTLKSRVKPADSATRDNPPPNTYHLNFNLSEAHKFSAITFGFGNRCNVTGQIKETPGPGTYKLPSAFDKFKRLPAKQYQSLKENGGLTPKMGHHRSKSNAEGNDLDMLDHNDEL